MESIKENLGKVAITVEKDYWSIDKAYDRLVIVEVKGAYKTYISRKPVPAGTMLNDREYWIPFSSLKEELIGNYTAWVNKINAVLENDIFVERTKEVIRKEQEREVDLLYSRIDQIKAIFPDNVLSTFILYDCAFDLTEKDEMYIINGSLEQVYENIPGSINNISRGRYLYYTTLNGDTHSIRVYFIIQVNVDTNNSNLEDTIPIIPDEGYYINASCISQEGYPKEQDNRAQINNNTNLYMEIYESATFVIKAKKE